MIDPTNPPIVTGEMYVTVVIQKLADGRQVFHLQAVVAEPGPEGMVQSPVPLEAAAVSAQNAITQILVSELMRRPAPQILTPEQMN